MKRGPIDPGVLEFFLYCEMDGKCTVRMEEETGIRYFTDVLQAMEFIMELKPKPGATLTVYDPLGRQTFKSLL